MSPRTRPASSSGADLLAGRRRAHEKRLRAAILRLEDRITDLLLVRYQRRGAGGRDQEQVFRDAVFDLRMAIVALHDHAGEPAPLSDAEQKALALADAGVEANEERAEG